MSPSQFELSIEDVRVSFGRGAGRIVALAGISLQFVPGDLTLIAGASGSGKTTLLTILGCLRKPDEGRVFIDGMAVHRAGRAALTRIRQRKIGFVFQALRRNLTKCPIGGSLSVWPSCALPRLRSSMRA